MMGIIFRSARRLQTQTLELVQFVVSKFVREIRVSKIVQGGKPKTHVLPVILPKIVALQNIVLCVMGRPKAIHRVSIVTRMSFVELGPINLCAQGTVQPHLRANLVPQTQIPRVIQITFYFVHVTTAT